MCGSFTPSGKLVEVIAVGGQGVLESAPFEREAANDTHHMPLPTNTVPAIDTVLAASSQSRPPYVIPGDIGRSLSRQVSA
ncbi:MAG: hypothetical protein JO253_06145, partial [Alphaproteobacteria bacterium]|nr:hypothetical protein [Alphaproteobacteria bacterium]